MYYIVVTDGCTAICCSHIWKVTMKSDIIYGLTFVEGIRIKERIAHIYKKNKNMTLHMNSTFFKSFQLKWSAPHTYQPFPHKKNQKQRFTPHTYYPFPQNISILTPSQNQMICPSHPSSSSTKTKIHHSHPSPLHKNEMVHPSHKSNGAPLMVILFQLNNIDVE